MSLPFGKQPPPAYAEPSGSQGGGGSIGPVIGVVLGVVALAVVAGLVGRLCSGLSILGYGHYDLHGWVERKCAACVDGRRPDAPPPQPSTDAAPAVTVTVEEAKQGRRKRETPEEVAES
ncbi:hypothetical protein OPV22_012467 [Ensete ventricosum]|uniref:Uncharacterized protein n=1 Tax=Ensete ventricosum TaxID=4639 RepID=A0AAV8R1N2_ENSVE|nr:hypothetical protein OPV22_012467 [Ensete ventricosum]RZR85257.1 hypothetical protein BHM03_00012197 [Ensete ventricosum]